MPGFSFGFDVPDCFGDPPSLPAGKTLQELEYFAEFQTMSDKAKMSFMRFYSQEFPGQPLGPFREMWGPGEGGGNESQPQRDSGARFYETEPLGMGPNDYVLLGYEAKSDTWRVVERHER